MSEPLILETRAIGKRIIEQDRLLSDGTIETRRNEALCGPFSIEGAPAPWIKSISLQTAETREPVPIIPFDCMTVQGTLEYKGKLPAALEKLFSDDA